MNKNSKNKSVVGWPTRLDQTIIYNETITQALLEFD